MVFRFLCTNGLECCVEKCDSFLLIYVKKHVGFFFVIWFG